MAIHYSLMILFAYEQHYKGNIYALTRSNRKLEMSQERLLHNVRSVMILAGYSVSENFTMRPKSFDIVANNGEEILILKVVSHIDSVNEEITHDLSIIAEQLHGSPLIVGERTRDSDLERGAVYLRYGIHAISYPTLHDYVVDNAPPLIFASPGGLYVNISGERLRELRQEYNLSLGDLAQTLGVSRRTVAKYESGMGTTIEIAIKIEEMFDHGIIESIDLLSFNPEQHAHRASHCESASKQAKHHEEVIPHHQFLKELGMELYETKRAPFQAMLKYDGNTILAGYGTDQKTMKHADIIGNISSIINGYALCVLSDSCPRRKIGKALVMDESSLYKIEEADELISMMSCLS